MKRPYFQIHGLFSLLHTLSSFFFEEREREKKRELPEGKGFITTFTWRTRERELSLAVRQAPVSRLAGKGRKSAVIQAKGAPPHYSISSAIFRLLSVTRADLLRNSSSSVALATISRVNPLDRVWMSARPSNNTGGPFEHRKESTCKWVLYKKRPRDLLYYRESVRNSRRSGTISKKISCFSSTSVGMRKLVTQRISGIITR